MKGMKYSSIEPDDIEKYLQSGYWLMEQKLDGIRCIVVLDNFGTATFHSHSGEQLKVRKTETEALSHCFTNVPADTVFDGELMANGSLWLFDVMRIGSQDVRHFDVINRRQYLDTMRPLFGDGVNVVYQASDETEKRALWADVQMRGFEGVVLKYTGGTYEPGVRTKTVLKCKITRTIDVVVIGRNEDGAENAVLGLLKGTNLVRVGKCSMIGKANAQVGDVIEVTFLYVADEASPSLYQPRMMRKRTDKIVLDCKWDQLDGCTTSKEVLV